MLGQLNQGLKRLGAVTDPTQITQDPSFFTSNTVRDHYDQLFAQAQTNLKNLMTNVVGIEQETQVVARSIAEQAQLKNSAVAQLRQFLQFVSTNGDKFDQQQQSTLNEVYQLLLSK